MRNGWSGIVEDFRLSHRRGSAGQNIEVNCPMCFDDPSYHLGLMTNSARFGCWRDPTHKGGGYSSVKRLLSLLLKVSLDKAAAIADSYFTMDEWLHAGGGSEAPTQSANLFVPKPKEFNPFDFSSLEEGLFIQYLQERDYDAKYIINRYNLHWCLYGEYAKRIIVPVTRRNNWISWTARSIDPGEKTRYRAAGARDNVPEPNEYLGDYENLSGGKLLAVCEGFFDAARIASVMIPGVQATWLFGQRITNRQVSALIELAPFYKRIVIAFDPKAARSAIGITENLSYYTSNCGFMPSNGKLDRGASSSESVYNEFKSYLQMAGI